ncbi:hypothetical protein CDAR_61101 [Caerostris darwini]|uniref:Uncharacterized protein n=1 Tax=Caerostris darwini TaxID=1538125 RepID=A0AAV4UT54_9ARAC|nr:hypothetical protein CDAR_61101 [Caerostris darwini]
MSPAQDLGSAKGTCRITNCPSLVRGKREGSMLAVAFLLLFSLLLFYLQRQKPWKKNPPATGFDESEIVGLTEMQEESETE